MEVVKAEVRQRQVRALGSDVLAKAVEADLHAQVLAAADRFHDPAKVYLALAVNLLQTKPSSRTEASCHDLVARFLCPPRLDTVEPPDACETDEQKLERKARKMDSVLGKRSAAAPTNPCPRCSFGDTEYVQQQIAHEDPTAKFYCPRCTNKWSRR
jgi:DNA-directed RNA polymerase subunit M/transcription elongation factor TFIIS